MAVLGFIGHSVVAGLIGMGFEVFEGKGKLVEG